MWRPTTCTALVPKIYFMLATLSYQTHSLSGGVHGSPCGSKTSKTYASDGGGWGATRAAYETCYASFCGAAVGLLNARQSIGPKRPCWRM